MGKLPEINNALGKPAVEQTQDFFAIFKTITATEPELIDKSSFKITYIVDNQGNVNKPTENADAARNIIQNFEQNNKVTIVLDQATSDNASLAGEHTIFSIGKPIPYLYSIKGIASSSFEKRLTFRNPNSPPSGAYDPLDNYEGLITTASTAGVNDAASGLLDFRISEFERSPRGMDTLDRSPETSPIVAEFTGSDGIYSIKGNQFDDDLQSLQLSITNQFSNTWGVANSSDAQYGVQIFLQYGNSGSGTWSDYNPQGWPTGLEYNNVSVLNQISGDDDQIINNIAYIGETGAPLITATYNIDFTSDYGRDTLLAFMNDNGVLEFRWKFKLIDGVTSNIETSVNTLLDGGYITFSGPQFSVFNQSPSPDNYYVDIEGSDFNALEYIEVPTSPSKTITFGSQISNFYQDFYVQTPAQEAFGLDPVTLPFNPQPGDRIRFQYNQNQDYLIYSVTPPAQGGGKLKLTLDGAPPTSSLQSFMLYKIDSSLASDMIINHKKITGIDNPNNPFTGIIYPEFPSENIIKNSDQILAKLKSEGIIEN